MWGLPINFNVLMCLLIVSRDENEKSMKDDKSLQ